MVKVPDFDAVYRNDSDPWQVHSSFYEQRKLQVVLATLSQPGYQRAWDPACGVGSLALRLAQRCSSVLASDASPVAVNLTARLTAAQPHITVRKVVLPVAAESLGEGNFDLVVLSEFMYYLDAAARSATLTSLGSVTVGGAEVMSLHWRHKPGDAWLSGADTQLEITAALTGRGWQHLVHHADVDFVLDTFRRGESGDD